MNEEDSERSVNLRSSDLRSTFPVARQLSDVGVNEATNILRREMTDEDGRVPIESEVPLSSTR